MEKKNNLEIARTQLEEAVHPEDVKDWPKFTVGGRTFEIGPLPFKWEKLFRKYAMPMVSAGLQPIEMLIVAAAGKQVDFQRSLGISDQIAKSENDIDAYIAPALSIVCVAQVNKGKEKSAWDTAEAWQEKIEDEMSRQAILELVEAQLDAVKAMDHLGNSFARRFKSLSSLLGSQLDLNSLMPSLTTPAGSTSATAGSLGSTVSRSSGTSTDELTPST